MTEPTKELDAWIGRSALEEGELSFAQVDALHATLDWEPFHHGAAATPLSHWMCFAPRVAQSQIDVDGHPQRGGFLPPIALPRRMWAGGRLNFLRPIQVGKPIHRESVIRSVEPKTGRSGMLVFVVVRHVLRQSGEDVLIEEQDIVFREAASPESNAPRASATRADEQFVRAVKPDPVLLFRYSALTFNGHRIHYDREYARDVEGYPGLVVHAPLLATLLAGLARESWPGAQLHTFEFKAQAPLYDLNEFAICGRVEGIGHVALWARDHEGRLAMQARAQLSKE